MDARRARGRRPDLARADRPARPRALLRGGARPRLGAQPDARHLPNAGRRQDLEARAGGERQHRRMRPRDGSEQPAHPVRRLLAGDPAAVGAGERRRRQRPVAHDRRRRVLEEGSGGAAREHPRQDHGGGVGTARAGVGDGGGREGRRSLPQRRSRRQVDASERRPQHPAAALVLRLDLHRSQGSRAPVGAQPAALSLVQRRKELRARPRGVGSPRHVDRPRRLQPHDHRLRRRGRRDLQRWPHLVICAQPADRAVLPRGGGRPIPLPGLRRAAGQLQHLGAERIVRSGDRRGRLADRGRRREWVPRARPARSRPDLWRGVRRIDHPLGPPPPGEPRRHSLHAGGERPRHPRPQVPVPVERADPGLALGLDHRVPRSSEAAAEPRRRRDVGGDQPRPHAQRLGPHGALGRTDHARRHRRRGVLHDLRARRVAARARRDVGRQRRRSGARDARRGQELAERHAQGPARVDPDQLDRGIAPREGRSLRGRHALQVRRLQALPLQDPRLRKDLDPDRLRHPHRGIHPRDPRGPGQARPAVRRHRDRALRVVRRRRRVDRLPAQPAGGGDHRSRDQER